MVTWLIALAAASVVLAALGVAAHCATARIEEFFGGLFDGE